MIRTRVALLAVILASASALDAQTKVSRGLHLNSDGAVRIYNLGGSVRVIGWNRDSVAVRGSIGRGSELHMGGGPQGVKMFVEDMDERNPAPANLEIYVPAKAKVWVKTATAGIEVSSVSGSLDLYVVSGPIKVTGDPADVNAEAIDGSIRIAGSPSWVRAKSASGDVSFEGKSGDITMSTVSGKIDVRGSRFEKAKFESVTGNISFNGSFERGGITKFDTHSGMIDLGVSGAADFDVVSISGTIANKLTLKRPIAGRYGRGSELVTESGDGGTRVEVRSFKGQVLLRPAGK
ncbi:MAG TPA: DUF4097 family beta strand repeat-containing protein [Gemmatimonadaceae bacterium]|nr:DUF4097 family beta strand repeat-containing protein [Gemmatimonadaceae bacterium]